MKLAMTMLVRDAADILEDNLRYHAALGVDLFVIADHRSTDGSLDILRRYESTGLVDLRQVEGPAQRIWDTQRTKLARRAHELGADWVIHDDQDEFWWPMEGTLKETFERIGDRYGLVVAPRTEFVPRLGAGHWSERLIYREPRFLRPPKAAHRAHPAVILDQPHPTRVALEQGFDFDAFHGRPGLDSLARGLSEAELAMVFAPDFPVRILHFPLRSFEQYRHRVEIAIREGELASDRRDEVREAFAGGTLEELYERLTYSDERVAEAVADGSLVEDVDLRDYLARCPAPLEGGPAAAPPAWPEERRARELEELRFDGMYAVTRYVRRHAVRRGLDVSRRERRELRRMKRSLWWRLRPRLPRALRRS